MKKGTIVIENHNSTVDSILGKIVDEYEPKKDREIAIEMVKDINPDDYNLELDASYTGRCSKCGKLWHECEHTKEEAHIIVEDIEVFGLSLVKK